MRIATILLTVCLAAGTAAAQRRQFAAVNDGTPEGRLLLEIGGEQDNAKKIALLEDFAGKYPQHEGLPWVLDQMVAAYAQAGQHNKALEAGARLLALDPEDVVTAHACLKAAEAAKNPDLILKWSETTSEIAHRVAAKPKPANEDEEDWRRRVDYARQVDVYTEYSLFAAMLQTADPKKRAQLGEALERRNPASQYLPQMAEQRFLAYAQAGEGAKAIELAERSIERNQASVEMLLAVADLSRGKKQSDRAIALSKQAIAAAEARPKPDGVAETDWQTWRVQTTGRAHWIAGMTYAAQGQYAAADQELRAALPGLKGQNEVLGEALFNLGLVNAKMADAGQLERARDALRFFSQCAATPNRNQATASKNVNALKAQYRGLR
ncbi:MAG: hypothetical protein ABSD56_02985 [Bryobacteraceae bacterium]